MKIFGPLYDRTLRWARHRHAPALLTGLSFIEAVFFPVPPEVMLAPMALGQPRRAFWFATLSLLGSLAGALVGYALGHYAFELVKPALEALGWLDKVNAGIATVQGKMAESPWAVFWFLVLGGFTPIPMKVFTWASGVVGVPMLPYLASMVIGRAKRLYLVALAIRLGGERAESALRRYIEPIGWGAMALLALGLGWLYWHAQGA